MTRLTLLAIAAILAPIAPVAAEQGRSLFKTSAAVSTGALEENGNIWFTTWDEGARFVLEKEPAGGADQLWQLLSKSNENARSVEVTFDVSAVRFNGDTGTLDFPICSVALEETVFTSARKCTDQKLAADKLAKSKLLMIALGWAEVRSGSSHSARKLLDQAVAPPELPKGLQIVALQARAQANDSIAYDQPPGTPSGDIALAAALADYRKLAALHTDEAKFRLGEAAALADLGDYAAAEQLYDAIQNQWPDERYGVLVRKSAIARLKGDYQRSLDLLNSLVPEFGPEMGMKFHYHRGWTLTRLGRFDEAIADFTEGFRSQADYPWAFLLRGCAYASIGQLDYAVADFESGTNLVRRSPGLTDSPYALQQLAVADKALTSLKGAITAGRREPMPAVCDGFWDARDKARTRSPLLTAAR